MTALTHLLVFLTAAFAHGQAVSDTKAPVDVLSMDQALRLALQNNTAILSAEQDVIIAQQRIKEAVFRFFPQTSLSGTATKSNLKYPAVLTPEFGSHLLEPSTFENFYTAKAIMVQPIYAGGRNTNTLRLAQAALKQARTGYEYAKRDAVYSLKNSFFRLMHAKEQQKAALQWFEAMRKLSAQSKPGRWEEIEQAALEGRMKSNQQLAEQELKLKKLDLLKSLNKELDSEIDINGDFRPNMTKVDLAKATVWAMEFRPELKGEIYKAEMDAIAVNLAMSRRSPTVLLGASYDVVGHEFPLRSNSWETTLSIQFPLTYDFWTQILQKKAEQRQGSLNRSSLQDKISLEVRQAYETLKFWQDEVIARYTAYDSLAAKFGAAAKDAPASLTGMHAALSVYQSHTAYLEAVREQLLAKAKLEWALGHEIPSE